MQSSCDLVIIGAGAAGLAAAKAAIAAGLNIEIIEAAGRIGGRAFTDFESFPAPFDHGCQWLHAASINPYAAIADRLGFRYRRTSFNFRIHDGKWWLNDQLGEEFGRVLGATYGRISAAGKAGSDVPAADFIDPGSRWADLFRRSFTSYMAASPDDVSAFDTSRFRQTGEDWPVEDGFGALIAADAAGIDVRLGCPVKSVDWNDREIMVGTARGMIFCRAVLVSVSIAVLQAERIKFFPLLPEWKRDAIGRIHMGNAEKVGLWLKRDALRELGSYFAMLDWPDAPSAGFLIRPFDRPMATMFAGGAFARDLVADGKEAAVAEAKSLLAKICGADILREVTAARVTGWSRDPLIGGAYSVLAPGGGEARADLARPVDKRLFFAGEATSPDGFSTAHGAHNSGVDAVAAIARALAD